MFKSKIDFSAFDMKNDKVKNLEQSKIKGLSKASVKKLKNTPGERTPFHMILDYFKDDKGKGQDHFLCFGLDKKMTKHFEQVEMKSGKLDKSMSANQKEASMGEAYVKEEGGKKILCFEPAPGSKIPGGRWPKILKSLKAYLDGLKAIVVIGGVILGEEDSEDSTEETTDADSDTDSSDTDSSDGAEGYAKLEKRFNKIQAQIKQVSQEKNATKKANGIIKLLANIDTVLASFNTFLEGAQGEEAKLASKKKAELEKLRPKISSMNDKIQKSRSDSTINHMIKSFGEVMGITEDMMSNHEEELKDHPEVMELLKNLQKEKI